MLLQCHKGADIVLHESASSTYTSDKIHRDVYASNTPPKLMVGLQHFVWKENNCAMPLFYSL